MVVEPLVDQFRVTNGTVVFLNSDLEKEALAKLQKFEKRFKSQNLISGVNKLTPLEIQEQIKNKAREIIEEYRDESNNAIENIFADLLSLTAFIWLLAVLKEFIGNIIYVISDSAKAFIIILFTDIFVGFHSPYGWGILLKNVSRHLGFPENRAFIYLFIATFSVIMDTIFKYWIFRYVNRISPSAVMTYRNMNE